jgi:hypothetical protein
VDDLAGFIGTLAEYAGCGRVEETTYGDHISLWIESGSRFLDAVEAYQPGSLASHESSTYKSSEEDIAALHSLCSNMRSLASEWRGSLDDDGSLTFYIDAF